MGREYLFGVEWESGFAALARDGSEADRDRFIPELMHLAKRRLPHLSGRGAMEMWLPNGSRFYVDLGGHPEFTTPECSDPREVVRYLVSAERTLGTIAHEVASRHPGLQDVIVLRSNVDYLSDTSWGCHESYLHRVEPSKLHKQLIPHLVSRIVYSGAGGFKPKSPGLEFTLSPRVWHLTKVCSTSSTEARAIVHLKDESLCSRGYHRLHLICGDTLCSQTANWLKIGTTALVVILVDNGILPGRSVQLSDPLRAVRQFGRDPLCVALASLDNGKRVTALQIQRLYLECAEAHLEAAFMPHWAAELCREWRWTLDALEHPESMSGRLDWCIKRAVYEHHLRRHGLDWKQLSIWSGIAARLIAGLRGTPFANQPLDAESLLGPNSPISEIVDGLTSLLRRRALDWTGLRPFLELRKELLEIDTRFGQVGDRGIFVALERAGVLSHEVSGLGDVEGALVTPPGRGRAHLRGAIVARHAGETGYVCDWQSVCDTRGRRMLDLSDPFATEERWKEMPSDLAEALWMLSTS